MAIGQLNLEAILRNFMPEETSENIIYFGTILFRLIIITIIFLIVKYLVESFFDANPAGRISFRGKQSPQRIKTINTLLRNFSMYILYFLFIYYLLTALGFPVGTLLAGAGIAVDIVAHMRPLMHYCYRRIVHNPAYIDNSHRHFS